MLRPYDCGDLQSITVKNFSWDCLRAEGKAGERSETDEGINCPSSALRAPSPWGKVKSPSSALRARNGLW